MNILLISPHFSPAVGGVETHLDDLCGYFNEQKYNVYVRTYKAWGVKKRGAKEEIRGSVYIHRMRWPDFNLFFKLEKYPILKFFYVGSGILIDSFLFLLQNQKKIDVIQTHGFSAAFIGIILGKLFKKKIVINTHVKFKIKSNLMGVITKWMLKNADQTLVLTDKIKVSLVRSGILENRVKVYHYWVDQGKFNIQKNAKKKLGWESKFVVLFVGRLIEVKGIQIIFDLAKSLKNITFAIAGSGPLSREASQESKKYPNIIFLGKIDNYELPLYYNGADLLLIPSKMIKQEYEEGIPRVMIEALSCGLPVVATKSGGIPDIYSDKAGLLVDDNLKSITEAIIKMIGKKRRMNNIRDYSLRLFSIKNARIIESSLYE